MIFIKMKDFFLIKNNYMLIYFMYLDFNYKVCLKLDVVIL